AAVELVVGHFGEDAARLLALIAVLEEAFPAGAALGPDDVEPYLGEAGGVAPWDLTDAIDAGDTALALTHLHRLLEGGERHPLVVLATLHNHYARILRVQGG